MKAGRCWALAGSVSLAASMVAMTGAVAASAGPTPSPSRVALHGSMAPAKARSHPAGSISANSRVSFGLTLALSDPAGAKSFVQAVSSPGSASFHKYLTDAQWLARFGPTQAELSKTESWLRQQGFTIGQVPKDRLFVPASGTAQQVQKAFGTKLGYFHVNGHKVRLADRTLTVPSQVAGAVSGVLGVNQYLATTSLARQGAAPKATKPADSEPAPPAAFANPQPCAAFWGQKTDTTDAASLYTPFKTASYDICGYKPAQLRGAYQLNSAVSSGNDGSGVTVAIVDAYDSPTLLKDAQKYFKMNDPAHPLSSGQFFNAAPATVDDVAECDGSGWFPEQALDVESSHAMAPGANILYVGAQDCQDTSLLSAVQTAVTSGASVVSDSWGDTLGDLLADSGTKTAFDNTFMLADATGVSVLFSSGDSGDNFADFGLAAPDYPASSPFITSVGGTTLEVNAVEGRKAEFGWSTAEQLMCTSQPKRNCGSATSPEGSLAFNSGAGGGTSFTYTQPFYQAGVVPDSLALRNENLFGPVPLRVEPDIAMDADAQSGMLIGLTEAFPHSVRFGEFKEGGTSLASPLMAGVIADADQAAGAPLGFINPLIYQASTTHPEAFRDIRPPAHPHTADVIRVDFANTVNATDGFNVSLRAINYAGKETFCDGTGNCASRKVTLTTTPGFDSITGVGSVGSRFLQVMSKF